MQSLYRGCEGREFLGEEEVLVDEGSGGEERVLEGVEDSVLGFNVGDQDPGVEVDGNG